LAEQAGDEEGGGKNRRKRKDSNKIERNRWRKGRKYIGIFHYITEETSSENCVSVKSESK